MECADGVLAYTRRLGGYSHLFIWRRSLKFATVMVQNFKEWYYLVWEALKHRYEVF